MRDGDRQADAVRTLQFASPEWVDRIEEILTDLVARHRAAGRLAGVHLTFSQTFRQVPPDGVTTGWGVVLSPEGMDFVREPIESDLGIVADYVAVLPIAHFEFGTASPDALAAIHRYWRHRCEIGDIVDIGSMETVDEDVRALIQELHDRQAREIA